MLTLIGAQPKLVADLTRILYKAAYEAYMTQAGACEDPGLTSLIKTETIKAANKFATKFQQEAAQPMAQAIYEFVKEIGIQAIVKGTLVATVPPSAGPVAGPIPMSDFIVT